MDDSLKRLRTDYIDVYFAHVDDTEVPLAETLGAFGKLVEAGKVRALGASNHSADRLREALAVSKQLDLPHYGPAGAFERKPTVLSPRPSA